MHVDPAVFDPASVDPETRRFNDDLEAQLAGVPPPTEFTVEEVRRAREEGKSAFGPIVRSDRAADFAIPGPGGPLPLRRVVPDGQPQGVYLHIHGGGWALGAADHSDLINVAMADAASVAVVSVDYRLAPEHPYPAGPDDCEAAAVWLIEHAAAEFGTDRLVIGGESAGGHLSVVTMLRMRDRHGYAGWRGANLVYGAYDLAMTPSQANWGERNLILSTPIIEWFADHFVSAARRREPAVSPLYADLAGLPPALFTVGTEDPLLDDTLFMAARWEAAGNRAEVEVYAGGIHAFDYFPDLALGQAARRRMHDFVAAAVASSQAATRGTLAADTPSPPRTPGGCARAVKE